MKPWRSTLDSQRLHPGLGRKGTLARCAPGRTGPDHQPRTVRPVQRTGIERQDRLTGWHRYQQGRRALELWGVETAQLIRHAPQVELLTLSDKSASLAGESLQVEGREVGIARREDISKTRGLVHARHVLIEDASFDWDGTPADCGGDWSYALRFSDGKKSVSAGRVSDVIA